MSFFEDLSPYTYFPTDGPLPTVNVGWLEPPHPFPIGKTSKAFQARLATLCDRRVNQTRGWYGCRYCKGSDRPHSSAELHVRGNGKAYAAPTMIHHYVVDHGYRPPEEFIAAVLVWNADAEPE